MIYADTSILFNNLFFIFARDFYKFKNHNVLQLKYLAFILFRYITFLLLFSLNKI